MTDNQNPSLISQNTSKASYSGIIRDKLEIVAEIRALVISAYASEIADAKLTDAGISALAETLSRVPDSIRDSVEISRSRFATPEKLYLWGIANATMVFPFLTLKSAEEHLKISRFNPQPWGYKDNKFHLPKIESIFPDSRTWYLLSEIIAGKFPEITQFDSDAIDSVPSLDNDLVERQSALKTVIIRIMELVRNPLSCTIRKTSTPSKECLIKDAVDFVLIEEIYQNYEGYENLILSSNTLSAGRRCRKQEYKDKTGKTGFTKLYQGYKLSEILEPYLDRSNSKEKSLEHEPFVAMILAFLRKLIPEDIGNYNLPKHIFEAPSSQLRNLVRQGPMIRTKKGMKHNLYVPFSFVKSTECDLYPEVIRKELVDAGSDVVKHLDAVNKMSLQEANENVPFYKDYISLVYTLSDICRKGWRQRGFIPNSLEVIEAVVDKLDIALKEENPTKALSNYIVSLRSFVNRGPSMNPCKSDKAEQEELVKAIAESLSQKKSRKISGPSLKR